MNLKHGTGFGQKWNRIHPVSEITLRAPKRHLLDVYCLKLIPFRMVFNIYYLGKFIFPNDQPDQSYEHSNLHLWLVNFEDKLIKKLSDQFPSTHIA